MVNFNLWYKLTYSFYDRVDGQIVCEHIIGFSVVQFFFHKIKTWHCYLKTETELEVLRKEIEENDKIEPELLAEFPFEDKERK